MTLKFSKFLFQLRTKKTLNILLVISILHKDNKLPLE